MATRAVIGGCAPGTAGCRVAGVYRSVLGEEQECPPAQSGSLPWAGSSLRFRGLEVALKIFVLSAVPPFRN